MTVAVGRRAPGRDARSRRRRSATTGGGAASSTRSTRAASPTATATASATCPGSSTTSTISDRTASASTPSGCRRSTRRPGRDVGYDVSDHATVDPLFGTEADFDRLVAEAHRRGIRVDPRPGHEPHERPASLVPGESRPSRDGPYADWYLWRDPAGVGRGRPAAAAQQLGVVVRRPGLDVGPGPRAVLPAHVPGRAARARTGASRRSRRPSSRWSAAGSTAASTASGSTSSTSSSSTPSCRPTRARRGDHGLGPPAAIVYDRDQPDFPDLIGRFRAIVDERPGPDVGRRAVRRRRPRAPPR